MTAASPNAGPSFAAPAVGGGVSWVTALLSGLIHSLALVLAFPPMNWWFIAVLAVAPLAMLGMAAGRGRGGLFKVSLFAGLGALPGWLWMHRFMWAITGPGYPAHGLYMAVYPALFVWLLAKTARRSASFAWLIGVPVLWVGLEVARGELLIGGYPWLLVGHPMIEFGPLRAVAPVLGVYGVGFGAAAFLPLMTAVQSLVASGQTPGRRLLPAALIAGVLLAVSVCMVLGSRYTPDAGVSLRLAAIQTNLPQSNKMSWSREKQFEDFERWRALTKQAAAADPKPDLIIWPETMFPGIGLDPGSLEGQRAYLRSQGSDGATRTMVYAAQLLADQQQHSVPLMVGAVAFDGWRVESDAAGKPVERFDGKFNSVVMLRGGKVEAERYDKMHLTPFGEEIPLLWRWPKAQQAVVGLGASGMQFDLARGRTPRLFELNGRTQTGQAAAVKVATPICYEVTFSETSRELAYHDGRRAADLLINLSNDGWFGEQPGARETHLLVARWRCVELGVPMFRSVNTGISAAIDSSGKLLAAGVDGRTEVAWVDGVLTHQFKIDPNNPGTIFGRVGNVFGWAVFFAALAISIWAVLPRRPSP